VEQYKAIIATMNLPIDDAPAAPAPAVAPAVEAPAAVP
jgi:hypothetical protein